MQRRQFDFIHILTVNIKKYTKNNQQAWPHIPKREGKDGKKITINTLIVVITYQYLWIR